MHSPGTAMANAARTGLEQTSAKFLRRICAVRFNTPSAMLLTKLGLSSLKAFWWQHTLEFFSRLATSLARSLFHLVLLDNQHDAFRRGVNIFCISIAENLSSVGYDMFDDPSVTSVLDVSAIMKLLHADPLLSVACFW